MSVLSEVLIVLATMGVASVLTVVLVVRMTFRRVRRSTALSATVLRARARLSAGPRHKVLQLRVRLDDALASAQAAVDVAARTDGPRGELPQLLRRIHKEGVALQSQLRMLETERDAATLAAGIPVAIRRVDEVTGMVRRLRSAVADGLGHLSDDTLLALRGDVDREVIALNAGVQELRTLTGYDDPRLNTSMDHLHQGKKS